MKKTLLKKYYILFLAAMVFLFVFMQQNISETNESNFHGNEKLQMLWEFDSGG